MTIVVYISQSPSRPLTNLNQDGLHLTGQAVEALEAAALAGVGVAETAVAAHVGFKKGISSLPNGRLNVASDIITPVVGVLRVAASILARLIGNGDEVHTGRVVEVDVHREAGVEAILADAGDQVDIDITISRHESGLEHLHSIQSFSNIVLHVGDGGIKLEGAGNVGGAIEVSDDEVGVESGDGSGGDVDVHNPDIALGGISHVSQRIITAGAKALAAVITTPATIATAALDLVVVPSGRSVVVAAEVLDVFAGTMARALVGAHTADAGSTLIAFETGALAGGAVADTLIGALSVGVGIGRGAINPSNSELAVA